MVVKMLLLLLLLEMLLLLVWQRVQAGLGELRQEVRVVVGVGHVVAGGGHEGEESGGGSGTIKGLARGNGRQGVGGGVQACKKKKRVARKEMG